MYENAGGEVGSVPITASLLKRYGANARVVEFDEEFCILNSKRFGMIKLGCSLFRTLTDYKYGKWLLESKDPCNLHVILDPNQEKSSSPRMAIDGHMIEVYLIVLVLVLFFVYIVFML